MNWREDIPDHPYPPRELLLSSRFSDAIPYLNLPSVGGVCALLLAGLDFVRLGGSPTTPIPFNYPVLFDVVLVVATLYVLESLHNQLDRAKQELILLARIAERRPNIDDSDVPDEAEIIRVFEDRMDWAFDPKHMVAGGLLLGVIVLIIMSLLGVLDAYPYLIMNFLFGAAHGIMLPALLILAPLLRIVPREFMNDINVIDPAGVGGYQTVGETIAKAAWYGVIIVNIDFIILGSVAFLDPSEFQVAVFVLYLLELGLLFGFTVGGAVRIRNVLKDIRDERIRDIQRKYGLIEGRFLARRGVEGRFLTRRGVSDSELGDMLAIITYSTLFNNIKEMNLWPINLVWWSRFLGSIATSILVITIQAVLVIDFGTLFEKLFGDLILSLFVYLG